MRIISGNTFFNDTSINFDNDLGSAYTKNFLDLSSNYGSGERQIYSGNSLNFGYVKCAKFFQDSKNQNKSECADFYQQSVNDGAIVSGIFNSTSVNASFVENSIFKDNSINSGISIIAHFCNSSQNFSDLETGIFCNTSKNYGFSLKSCFKDSSTNLSTIINNAEFLDTSCNHQSGVVKDSLFLNSSINYGSVKNSIFDCSSANSGIVCDSYFSGNSINLGSAINSSFVAFSKNQSTNFSGIFNFASVNFANLDYSQFYKYSINSGLLKTGIFFDRSINKASSIDYGIFSGDSLNYGYVKTGIFYKSGKNFGTVDVFIDGNVLNKPLSGFYSSGYFEDGNKYNIISFNPSRAIDTNKYYIYSGNSVSLASGIYDNGFFYSGDIVDVNYSIPFLSSSEYWYLSGLESFSRAGIDNFVFYSNGVFRNGRLIDDQIFYSKITGSGNSCYYISGQYLSGLNGLYTFGCFDNAILNTSLITGPTVPLNSNLNWYYQSGSGSIACGLFVSIDNGLIISHKYTGGIIDVNDGGRDQFGNACITKAVNSNLVFVAIPALDDQNPTTYTYIDGPSSSGWFNLGSLSIENEDCKQQWMDFYNLNYSGSGDSIYFAKSDYDWNFYACYSDSQTGVFSGYSNLNPFKINQQFQENLPLSIWNYLRDNSYLTGIYSIFDSGNLKCADGYFSSGYFVDGCLMTTLNTGSFEVYEYPSLTPQSAKNIQLKNCYYIYADLQNIILNTPTLSSGVYSNGAFFSGDLVSYFAGPLIPKDVTGQVYYRYTGLNAFLFSCSTPLNTGNNIWFTYSNGIKNLASGYYSNGYITGGVLTAVANQAIIKNIDSGTYSLYNTDSTVTTVPDGLFGDKFYLSGLNRNFYKTNFDYQSSIYGVFKLNESILYFANGSVVDLEDPVLNTGNSFYFQIKNGESYYYNNSKPQVQNGTGFVYTDGYKGFANGYYSNGFFGGPDITGGSSQIGIKAIQYRNENAYDVIQAKDNDLFYKYNYSQNVNEIPLKYTCLTPSVGIVDNSNYHVFNLGTGSLASGRYSNGVYESGVKLDYYDFLFRSEIFSGSHSLLDLQDGKKYTISINENNSYSINEDQVGIYWSNSSGTDWFTLNNWYSNASLSNSLGRLPSISEDVIIRGNQGVVINIDNPQWIQPHSIDTRLNSDPNGIPLLMYSTQDKQFSGIIIGDSTFSGVVVL
jgi:hypothetical protein